MEGYLWGGQWGQVNTLKMGTVPIFWRPIYFARVNMPAIVENQATEVCLRSILLSEGYSLSPERLHGETGVDIIATNQSGASHIEVIGHKSSGPARAKDFYEVFFRAISRLKDGAEKCVIALPSLASRGLPARANQYGEAWSRIGRAFPELEIWLIDIDTKTYTRHKWNEWLL